MRHSLSSLGGRLKTRLELVRGDLDEVVGRLVDADLSWAPREGMRTIGGQLTEIAEFEMQLHGLFETEVAPSWEEVHQQAQRSTVAEYKELLAGLRAKTVAMIDSQSDEELDATISVPSRWFEALRLEATPKSEVLRSLAAHEWYHTGQLVSYLWSRGDNPCKW